MQDGVLAERCDSSNSFAVKQRDGRVDDPCSFLPEGPGGYHYVNDKPCECAATQIDWMNGSENVGWKIRGPQQSDCTVEDEPDPPTANFSAVCYPADQEYNDLSYRFSLNNITGSGEFQQATLFLSFNNNNQSTEQESAIKGFLGEPTWPSGAWYGYWLDRQFSMNNQSLNFRTWDEQLIIGGDKGNQKTIDDLVNQTQTWIQQGIFPENYTYLVEASVTFDYNGTINKTDSVGNKRVSLLPNACAEPPPAPQCTNIQMFPADYPLSSTPITDFSTLEIGQQVRFLCEVTPADPKQIFKYRVIRVDDGDPTKGLIVENFNNDYSIGQSGSFKIPDSGKYFAQCVTCGQIGDSEFNCAEWEPIPNITVQDMPGGPAPIDESLHCRTNASEQGCVNDIQCIKCYGSGAVCNDNGRCEIPTGGMPID
jgi:hypothetical protein